MRCDLLVPAFIASDDTRTGLPDFKRNRCRFATGTTGRIYLEYARVRREWIWSERGADLRRDFWQTLANMSVQNRPKLDWAG